MSSLNDRTQAGEGTPVVAVWREPFSLGQPTIEMWRQGMTVYEIVKAMRCLPADFEDRGVVQINGNEVNRGAWHLVRPKGSTSTLPVAVTFHMPLRGSKGGKGGGGKQIIGIVALLAITLLTAGIAAGLAAPLGTSLGGLFAAGSISAKLLAGAVGIMGALAVAALTRPPTAKPKAEDVRDETESASAEGNTIEPNGGIPRVIGTRKIFPPLAAEPHVELVGEDEYVSAVYIMNGPHAISDIKIGEADISDDDTISYQVREGWQSDELQTIQSLISRTSATNSQLKSHTLSNNSSTSLLNQANPNTCIPKWERFATRDSPDRVAIHLLFPGGIYYSPDPATYIHAVPIRVRMRLRGQTAWRNLPEIHFRGQAKSGAMRGQIMLRWDETEPTTTNIWSTITGWCYTHTRVPAQNLSPVDSTYQWEADSYFYSGSGDRWAGSSYATTGVQHCRISSNGGSLTDGSLRSMDANNGAINVATCCDIYLDSATWPKGIYEIEIMRGEVFYFGYLDPTNYVWQTYIRNFFKYYNGGSGVWRIHNDQKGLEGSMIVARIVSIWNEVPVPLPGFATIALLAKNKQIQGLSCTASGYVQDWDGSGWATWTTTSNPAPHYRDILVGRHNIDPVPTELIDDDELVAWRTRCALNSYTCDMIADGMRIDEVLNTVASCGYAQPYWSDQWSIIQDYDRSAESPVQVFTPRNSRGFQFRKAFPRMPDGLLISYRSDDQDYRQQQVAVYRNGVTVVDGRIEQTSYEGLVDVAKIRTRGAFDLKQAEYRSTFYTLEASVDSLVCRRGSLVAVQHDVVTKHCGAARITSVTVSGGNITAIKIDAKISLVNEVAIQTVSEISTVAAIEDVGLTMGCSIRRTDGTITTHALSNTGAETDVLTFTTPFANDTTTGGPFDPATINEVMAGCLVVVGPLGEEYIRLIVSEIIPGADLTARLTLIDEAPELWA